MTTHTADQYAAENPVPEWTADDDAQYAEYLDGQDEASWWEHMEAVALQYRVGYAA
jgi:hypothetical protein